ncbi:MAG: helix-turn-helix transcriptional regulator, partial [Pseudomonadota bacterium]
PLPGGAYVTLNLDSAESDFPDPVMARAEEVAGTFLGLHQAHLRLAAPTSTSALPDQPSPAPEALPAYDALIDRMAERHAMTAREREIAHRALRGYPNALIARDLGITAGTVRNHRARLYAKLDITSERELFALCLETLLDSPVSAPV